MAPISSDKVSDGGSRASAGDIALDQPAQCKRYGKHPVTFKRWREKYGYPEPSFYIAGVPYIWLSVLAAWEAKQPTHSKHAGKTPNPRAGQTVAAA